MDKRTPFRQLSSRDRCAFVLPSVPTQQGAGGSQENMEVRAQASGLKVLQVQLHPALEAQRIPVRLDLPETGDTWPDRQPLLLPGAILGGFPGERRTGTDKAHIPPEDVPQLG